METTITKKFVRTGLVAFTMLLLLVQDVLAQRPPVVGDFKTVASGDWEVTSVWQVYTGAGKNGWVNAGDMPAGQQVPGANSDVFITRGFTVTMQQNGMCNNLYISTVDANSIPKANLVVGANVLEVSGKISGFIGVPGSSTTTGTIAGSGNPAELATAAAGKIKITGLSRTIIQVGEWSENSNNFNVEIALTTTTETASLGRAFGVQNLTITSGILDATNKLFYAQGDVNVASGGTISTSVSGANAVVSGLAGSNGGAFTVNGTLVLKGASPAINMTTVDFSGGTVVYNGGTAPQTIIVSHNGAPVAYNNLSLSTAQEKSVPAGSAITVNGVLSVDAGSKLVLNGGQLNLNGTVAGGGTITSDAAASIEVGGNGNIGTLKFTAGGQVVKRFAMNRAANGMLTLSSPLAVAQTLELTKGVIATTAANLLTVADNATVTGGNEESNIEGPLARNLAVSGTATQLAFPIGKGGVYRPVTLTVTHSSAGTNTYTAEQFNTAPASRSIPATIQSVSASRYFSINKAGAATVSNVVVGLHYGSEEGIADETEARIVKSAGVSEPWTDLGRNASASPSMVTSSATEMVVSSNNFTTFSDFAVAKSVPSMLPVEFIAFEARLTAGQVSLNWATASEKNNDHFVVERSASPAVDSFKAVATVKGTGTSANVTTYTATDNQPLAGTAYYRLKQVDTDGTVSYSKLVAVYGRAGAVALVVYPNPATDKLTVALPETGNTATLKVVNALGQVVITQTIPGTVVNEIAVDVAAFPAGAYQVLVTGTRQTASAKFIKASN